MTLSTTSRSGTVTDVTPEDLRRWLDDGGAALVDVREDFEHAAERIEGAEPMPLSRFDAAALRDRHGERPVVFHCRTGKRSLTAANRYRVGEAPVYHLAGGIEAWKAAGQATRRSSAAPTIDVMRQVQMTAGSLVLIGVLLGAFVSPWFLILSGFVGGGLFFAGASGWCGMAMLLAKMPWNRAGSRSSTC